jgi:hypothetical protein
MFNIPIQSSFAFQDIARDQDLTARQCDVLDMALDSIKQYFYADGHGLKQVYLDASPELKTLRYALTVYTQTTDSLISKFVQSQNSQGTSEQYFNVSFCYENIILYIFWGTDTN